MKSIADQLPPEIARQIHPDRRKNEAEYWAVRDKLLEQYRGQWIGFADGKVIASGTSPVTVFHAAESSGQHPLPHPPRRLSLRRRLPRRSVAETSIPIDQPH
jgi:hypothetical protein